MEGEIIEKLKQMGKITEEDVSEALKQLPSAFEIGLILDIRNSYDDTPTYTDIDNNIWISHFLPILREESFKCMEKVRELETTNDPD